LLLGRGHNAKSKSRLYWFKVLGIRKRGIRFYVASGKRRGAISPGQRLDCQAQSHKGMSTNILLLNGDAGTLFAGDRRTEK